MLKLLMLPMCPEEDRKDTSEPELDFRTDKYLSFDRPVSSKFIYMLMLNEFKPNLALNQTKYIAATAPKHISYLHILWKATQRAFYLFLHFFL